MVASPATATRRSPSPLPLLRLIPVAVVCFILAAHFLRIRLLGPMVAAAALPLLLAIPRRWAARLLQTLLVAAAVFWLVLLARLAGIRQEMGLPWLRLAAILVSLSLATAAAALLLEGERPRRWFRQTGAPAAASVVTFWLTAVLLAFVQLKVPRPMILAERFWVSGGWVVVVGLGVYAAWAVALLIR